MPDSGHEVRHAQLRLEQGVIMIGTRRDDDVLDTPSHLGGCTQMLCISVSNIEAQYERAVAAKADIINPLVETDLGARQFDLRDPEGHIWVLTDMQHGL